jgi:hypothetical protein
MTRKSRMPPWVRQPERKPRHNPEARELAKPRYGQRVVPDGRREAFSDRHGWRHETEEWQRQTEPDQHEWRRNSRWLTHP